MLIGGALVRSESGRAIEMSGGNVCRSSRKDVRDAVKSARAAWPGWQARTAYNRGQIVYRLAEMLEARSGEFAELLGEGGGAEVAASVDLLVHYAGWADKYQQCLGTVNPVAMPYFNFSFPEPMGVVGATANRGLNGLLEALVPAITGGNTVVVLADDGSAIVASEFSEVVATSDVPGGVVNILTGLQSETLPHLAKHMDVNALVLTDEPQRQSVLEEATENLKRLVVSAPGRSSLEQIRLLQETKTVWHPVGV
ncbi:MAG: aldehyde dehydrogenase family protein [Armatimonadetes bacterium]|nr:aldehyde dehydrogenase family protein [Armatimonadota bacterium]